MGYSTTKQRAGRGGCNLLQRGAKVWKRGKAASGLHHRSHHTKALSKYAQLIVVAGANWTTSNLRAGRLGKLAGLERDASSFQSFTTSQRRQLQYAICGYARRLWGLYPTVTFKKMIPLEFRRAVRAGVSPCNWLDPGGGGVLLSTGFFLFCFFFVFFFFL